MNDKLLIIYYHEVVEEGHGFSYQKIEKGKFNKQMKYLHDKGYKTLFFSELTKKLPDKALIVSFDDGFRTVYENAAPIMKKYGIKGNIYLPTAYIDNNNYFMTWKMVQELYESKQFEMQAHTHNHKDIRTLDKKTMSDEIVKSHLLFKKKLGYLPETFCMPFGTYDHKSTELLRKSKQYNYILGSYYGHIKEKKLKTNILPRIGISNDDDIKIFKDKLEGKYDWKGPLQRMRLLLQNIKHDRITEYKF